MDLSIVIVSWNVKDLLQVLLKSIYQYTQGITFEIFVVDNNSSDGSVEMVAKQFPDVNVLINNQNIGFAKANNQGLEFAQGRYILFMNPDMELTENSFGTLVTFMDENQDVSLCGCTLKYPDGELQNTVKKFPRFNDQLLVLLKLHHVLKTKSLKRYLAKDFDYSSQGDVRQLMGAFVMCRREAIMRLGGWSEDYPIWWEDVDLCYRARLNKLRVVYTPITSVIHHESKSFSQQASLYKQKRFIKGMLVFFYKHRALWQFFILWLLSPVSLFLAWVTQILKIKPRQQSRL